MATKTVRNKMTNPTIEIFDAITNENIVREMTDEEFLEHSNRKAAFEAAESERLAKLALRQSALEKLGLTAEEVAALLA
jgi:hypothetical protein